LAGASYLVEVDLKLEEVVSFLEEEGTCPIGEVVAIACLEEVACWVEEAHLFFPCQRLCLVLLGQEEHQEGEELQQAFPSLVDLASTLLFPSAFLFPLEPSTPLLPQLFS
jgi:hypothetical protein